MSLEELKDYLYTAFKKAFEDNPDAAKGLSWFGRNNKDTNT